jgi:hypothetical protein
MTKGRTERQKAKWGKTGDNDAQSRSEPTIPQLRRGLLGMFAGRP